MRNNENEKILNKIIYLLSFVISFFVIYMLSKLSESLDYNYITTNYFKPTSDFVAEKKEVLQYILGILSFCCSYFILKLCANHYKPLIKNPLTINKIVDKIFLVIGIFLGAKIFFVFEYNEYRIIFTSYKFLIFISYILFLKYYIFSNKNEMIKNRISIILILLIILVVGIAYFSFYYDCSNFVAHHSNAYYYPILKLWNGLIPGIDYTSIYGYYSYFYYFIMKVFNNNSIGMFSIINSVLVIASLLNISYFANKLIKNKKIVFLTISSIVFYLVVYHLLNEYGIYMQFFPHRVLFPSIFLAYIAYAIKKLDNEIFIIIGYIISSLSMFYNIETGLVIFLTFNSLMIYKSLINYTFKDKKLYLNMLKYILYSILTILLYLLIIIIITYFLSGKIITINSIIFGIKSFLGSGFYMLRMPTFGPWIIIGIIYSIYLVKCLNKIKIFNNEEKVTSNEYLIFTLTVFGIGLFSYYQGRSHTYVFTLVIYPMIILISYTLSQLIKNKKQNKVLTKVIGLFLVISSFLSIYNIVLNDEVRYFIFNKSHNNRYFDIYKILTKYSYLVNDIPDLQLLSSYESRYYLYYNIKDDKPLEDYVDMFTYKQIKNTLNYLKSSDKSIIINKEIYVAFINKFSIEMKFLFDKYYMYRSDEDYILINKNDIKKLKDIEELGERIENEKTINSGNI